MPNPPTIDVADDWLIFDNLQPVTLLNKDGSTKSVPWALQEGIDTIMADMGDGTIGFRTFSTWHVWKQQCDPFVPQINCKLTDKEGRNWYVANVNLHVWGNKYQLDCELQAGLGVVPVNLPVYVTTTSTTCAPTYAIRHLVRITDEQFVCAYPTSDGWSGYSGAEVGSGLFRWDLVDPYIVNDIIVTVRSEALDPNTDTVYIRRNGVAVTANIAGELYQYTFTGSQIQPNDTYDIVFNSLYPLPESAVQFSVQSVINCEGGTFCGVHFDNGTYFCAQGTHTGWEAYNNSLPQAGITSAIWNWSPQDLSKFTEFTVTVNAQQMQAGSVYVKKNNVNISGNIASTSWTYTEDQAQYADSWELFIDALGAIPEAVVNASVVVACVPTTSTTTTTSTSTTSTTTSTTSTSTTSTSSTTSTTSTPAPLVANYFEINDPQTTYINWTPIGSNGFSFQNNYTNATFNTTSPITITQNGFIRFTDIILAGGSGAMGVFAYYGNVIAFFPGYTNDIWTPCTVGSGDFSIQFLDSAAQTRTVGQLSGTIEWYPTTTTTTTSTTSTSTTSTTTTSTTTTSTTTTSVPYVTSGLRLFVDAGDPASYSGSGTAWNDLSGNGNDLTLTGSGTTFNSTGGYFSFNGSGYAQRLACSNMPTGNNAASMSVWFRMPQSATPHYDLMCYGGGVGVGCGTSIWLALWPVGTRQVYWFYNCYDFGGNTGVNGDVWVNVTGTKDSSGLRKLYVNGVLVATGVNENMLISGTQFRIAWDNYENQPKFVGDLSIGMVYDKELTPAEVIQNYEAFRGRYDLFVNYDISNTSSTFQDAAGTIPAIANNDPVRLIKDVAPAGKWDQNQVLYGDPPLLEVPGQNGLNTLYYIGLNQGTYRAATGVSSYPFLPGSYTAFFVYTRSNSGPSNGGNADIMRVQALSGTDLFENGAHGNVYVLRNTAGTLQSTGGWTNPGQTGYGLIIYDYDETLSEGKVYDAANAQLGATLTPAAPLSNKQMRWDINNNGDGSFHLAEIRVYQRCLDATERATIIAQLQAKWGI